MHDALLIAELARIDLYSVLLAVDSEHPTVPKFAGFDPLANPLSAVVKGFNEIRHFVFEVGDLRESGLGWVNDAWVN
jgi:hypothetical protein